MRIQLSDHFNYRKLIAFTLPSIAMMIFTSVYGVVDGFFVSNFAGKTAFSAVNLIMPFLMIVASMNIVGMLYNIQLMKYAGEDGIAAYGVMMYVSFIFASTFIGYSVGSAPIIGFHDGAKNRAELKGLLKKSVVLIGVFALAMLLLGELLALPLSKLFVGYDKALLELTVSGFKIFAVSFLFMGYAIFGSGFFTALNDGVTSAIISFLRTLVFQIAAVLLLPMILGIDGIWYSIIAAEFMAAALSAFFILLKKNKYHYL